MNLFSGDFNKYNFVKKEPSQNIGEQLPQINVKPLDIVEPQMLGKSSLMGKSTTSTQGFRDSSPNDFQPSQLKKNHSEKALPDMLAEPDEKGRSSEGAQRKEPVHEDLRVPDAPIIQWKTIFRSQKLPIGLFSEHTRSVSAPWLLAQGQPAQPQKPKPIENQPKYDSNVSTGHSNNESTGSHVETTPEAPQKAPEPAPNPPISPAPQAPVKGVTTTTTTATKKAKEPVTIESIFKKYRQLNKTVTKIVHKKNNGRTEKWVYFSDGTSVLEDPGEDPEPVQQPVESNMNSVPPQQMGGMQQAGLNNQWQPQPAGQTGAESGIQPSNVYFYDHSNLVAEFDPENPNNIALTLYEITTLQQKHMYCKYFEPGPDAKYRELGAVVDFSSAGNPSVYHQLDQLNDEDLLRPKQKEEQKVSGPYWTKSLRKSNKRLISKKSNVISRGNKVISKQNSRPISN